jgi:hypothetical protein
MMLCVTMAGQSRSGGLSTHMSAYIEMSVFLRRYGAQKEQDGKTADNRDQREAEKTARREKVTTAHQISETANSDDDQDRAEDAGGGAAKIHSGLPISAGYPKLRAAA